MRGRVCMCVFLLSLLYSLHLPASPRLSLPATRPVCFSYPFFRPQLTPSVFRCPSAISYLLLLCVPFPPVLPPWDLSLTFGPSCYRCASFMPIVVGSTTGLDLSHGLVALIRALSASPRGEGAGPGDGAALHSYYGRRCPLRRYHNLGHDQAG